MYVIDIIGSGQTEKKVQFPSVLEISRISEVSPRC